MKKSHRPYMTRIYIQDLFGIEKFTYDIPLPIDETIEIITGFNGYGKTTILRMINSLFEFNPVIFEETPFSEFYIQFENDYWIRVIKDPNDINQKKCLISSRDINAFTFTDEEFIVDPKWMIEAFPKLKTINDSVIKQGYSLLDRLTLFKLTKQRNLLSQEEWRIIHNNILLRDRVIQKGINFREVVLKIPNYKDIRKIIDYGNIMFIDTQRLLSNSTNNFFDENYSRITEYCEDIQNHLNNATQGYIIKSKLQDKTFPNRMIDSIMAINHQPSGKKFLLNPQSIFDYIKKILHELNIFEQPYINVGLLDSGTDDVITKIENISRNANIDDVNISVLLCLSKLLEIYVSDIKERLSCYEDLLIKFQRLQTVFSSKISTKELLLDYENGIVFRMIDDKENKKIPINKLSSGEKHLFVMYYQLIFKTTNGTTVLIDEPEISMHITWLQDFYDDLKSISEINNLKYIIATHSVDVIDDKWPIVYDLYTKCRGEDEIVSEL